MKKAIVIVLIVSAAAGGFFVGRGKTRTITKYEKSCNKKAFYAYADIYGLKPMTKSELATLKAKHQAACEKNIRQAEKGFQGDLSKLRGFYDNKLSEAKRQCDSRVSEIENYYRRQTRKAEIESFRQGLWNGNILKGGNRSD